MPTVTDWGWTHPTGSIYRTVNQRNLKIKETETQQKYFRKKSTRKFKMLKKKKKKKKKNNKKY